MQTRVISSLLLKRLPRVFLYRADRASLSTAAKPNEVDDFFDNFVKEIKKSPVDAIKPKHVIKELLNLQELNELIRKPAHSYDEISLMLRTVQAESSKSDFADLIERDEAHFLFLDDLKNPDRCLSLLTLLINTHLQKSKLFDLVFKKLHDLNQCTVSVAVLNGALLSFRNHGVVLEQQTEKIISKLLESAIEKIETPAELLSLLHNYNGAGAWKEDIVPKAKVLLPVMNLSEIISTFRGLSEKSIRDTLFMKLMAQRIAESKERMTINQLVALCSSCAKMNFFDARVIRRVGDDLHNDVNLLNSWNDVSSLVNSFSRLNLGHCSTWEILSTWVDGHLEAASVRNVSMVVSGMARMNIKRGKRAAEWLCKNLRREAAKSPFGWLSAIHSLAFYEVIPTHLAETVLSKDFVMELMKADISDGEKIYQAQKILQIQGVISCMYGESYKGPRVDKSSFGNIFSDENKTALYNCKYRTEGLQSDAKKKLFDEGLWMLYPKKYIGPAMIDEFGTFCDASVVVDKDEHLMPFSQWGGANPRPVLFISYLDTTKSTELNVAFDETVLQGPLSIGLRLLERNGWKPIVIYDQQLIQISSVEDKLKFIKMMEVYQFGEQNDSSPECCVVRQDLLSYCKQDGKGEINIYLEKNVEDLLFGFVVLNIQEEDFNNLDTSNLYPNIFSFKFRNGPPFGQAGDLIKLQFEFKKNRRGDLLIGVRCSLKRHAFSRRSETFGWSERKVSFSPRILRFAIKAPQGSLFVLSNNDVERLLLKPALLESCRIKYVCNYCLSHFPRMCAPPCGHTVCVTCEKQLPKSEIRNGKRHIKCPVSCNDDLHTLHHLRFRNGPCPLEETSEKPANCKAIALIPCGCVLSHQPTKELTICPFELCQQKVYNFMKLYFEEDA